MITRLQDINSNDINRYGGKACHLARLQQTGVPVPTAFVLETTTTAPMITDAASIISDAVQQLGTPSVAVRSSAICEDGAQHSYAGMFSSFLCVKPSNVVDRILQCKASADNERVQQYDGENDGKTEVAVIVQTMIYSTVSGVCFSKNPVTNNEKQMVIEASYGLGEAIVSGAVTPDTYIIDKGNAQVVQRFVSRQEKQLQRGGSSTMWHPVVQSLLGQAKLDQQALQKIKEIADCIENLYQQAVDIEWAYQGDELFVTQTRPVTTD